MPASRTFERERTAALILEALELGMPPARMLEEFYEIPYSKARYMVRVVREDGLLGIAPHHPVRVSTRRRGGPVLLVCAHCQNPWPCPGGSPTTPVPSSAPRKKRRGRS
jgi:hypothetical protein